MHNSRFVIGVVMAEREREHTHRNRHAWKRSPQPVPRRLLRRAMAALRRE